MSSVHVPLAVQQYRAVLAVRRALMQAENRWAALLTELTTTEAMEYYGLAAEIDEQEKRAASWR